MCGQLFFDLTQYKIINKLLSFLIYLKKTIVVIEKQVRNYLLFYYIKHINKAGG